MKQQHHPIDLKTYEKGINSDTNKEILGVNDQGEHVDALNMRSISMDGDNSVKKKIKGESLIYPNIDNRCIGGTGLPLSSDYECMMTQEINGHLVEIWASETPNINPPLFRVDGKIVAMSNSIPIELSYPLQYHKNENCVSGEFYVTNNNTAPMVFSLKDLMGNSGMLPNSSCTQKYFEEFNIDQYVIQVSGTLFKPSFIKQVATSSGSFDFVLGSNGLAVGSYSYSYRYVSQDGDRTPFSPITELIPVVRNSSSQFNPHYPYSRTFSSEPDISSPTQYGNHIRIKYDNDSNFSFLEIRRDSWYGGQPVNISPTSEIIGSIPLQSGLNIIDVLDRVEPTFDGIEILTLEEQSSQYSTIAKAKSIRYFNERLYLMNIGYNSKDIEGEVSFVDDVAPIFPVIQNLGKPGHKHVYNAAMYKSNMRGERTGFGVVFHDKGNNSTYGVPIPNSDNFLFPNRREEVSSETLGMSYFGVVTAANVDGQITNTHEVFDHEDAVRKETFTGPEDWMVSLEDNDPYNTLSPTSQNDSANDLKTRVNSSVGAFGTPTETYRPKGFGLNYFSQGIAFKGISSSPSNWNEGFSVVQTEPANRVVAQGLGFYSMFEAEGLFGSDSAKSTDQFWSYFPDLDLLTPEVLDDLINNPTSYQLQLVSPLGYFTEMYSGFNDDITLVSKGVDIMTYARVLKDGLHTDGEALFNPLISGGGSSGKPHTDGLDYVAYGRYTNKFSQDSPAFPLNQNGNAVFQIVDVGEEVTYSGRQVYVRLELSTNIYNNAGPNPPSYPFDGSATSPGAMEWREPLYVINLVKNDVQINSGLTTSYKYSSSYVKFNSKILESDGSVNQSVVLVSERWEDCIPAISGQLYNDYSNLYRFIYVVDAQGLERRWLNVDLETPATISTILGNISVNGFDTITDSSGSYNIYGIYTSQQSTDGLCPIFTINFNYTQLQLGSSVYVKYDNRIPVRVFGGDTYINESIWAVIDNEYKDDGEPVDDQAEFRWNVPFPFTSYQFSSAYRVLKNSDSLGTHNYVQDTMRFNLNSGSLYSLSMWIRQLAVMWTAETKINLSFAFNNESPDKANSDQFFPLINYIPRPHKWKSGNEDDRTTFEANNSMNIRYFDDYGYEWNLWKWGGIRFTPQTNLDYSKSQNTLSYITVPTVGFDEQTEFCTRIVWSERRPINIQNTPTVKTFQPQNYFDISDNTGEIKFAWSALSSDKGNNLYAITASGICLLLVDKRIIHEINANELATVGSDIGGILNQLWIDQTRGMGDETWRTWAEYSNALFFVNNTSAYSFSDNQINDIGRLGFSDLLRRKFISLIGNGYESRLSGGFNPLTREYVMNVDDSDDFSTLIYGTGQESLQCQSSYNYDKYIYFDNRFFGFKDLKTYEIGIGNLIDGVPMECYVSGVSDKEIYFDKEFIRIRVNSNFKPDKIFFYDSYDDYKIDNFSSVVDAVLNPISIKDYFGYECYIPRKLVSPHYRQQGRLLIFKIVSTSQEDFLVTSTGVQYKSLK